MDRRLPACIPCLAGNELSLYLADDFVPVSPGGCFTLSLHTSVQLQNANPDCRKVAFTSAPSSPGGSYQRVTETFIHRLDQLPGSHVRHS